MKNSDITKQHLPKELEYLRKRVTELEARDNSLYIFENLLRTSEADSVSILESITELITFYDEDMAVLWANRAAVESAGLLLEEMVGRHCYEIWPGLGKSCPECPVSKALDTCRPYSKEMVTPNGRWWLIKGYPVLDEDGKVVGAVEITTDISQRKHIEQELRYEKEFAQGLINTAQAIVLTLDLEGRITYFNTYMEEISGYCLEEVTGKNWIDTFIPHRDQDDIRNLFNQAIGSTRTRGNINPIITKDGRERIIEWYDKKLDNPNGDTIGLLAIGHDVTERKQAEDKYKQLLDDINDGYAVIQEGNIVFANDRFGGMFGYQRSHVQGMSLTQFLKPDAGQEMMELYKRTVSGEEPTVERREIEALKGDGTTIIIETNGKVIQYEGKPALSVIARDITDRKQMEKDLRESNDLYRSLIETASKIGEGILLVQNTDNKEGVIIFANEEIATITGYSRKKLIGMTMPQFIPPEDIPEIMDRYRKRQAGEKLPSHYEMSIVRKDGTRLPVELGLGITTYQGKTASIAFMRDITDRKQAEEALQHREEHFRSLIEHSYDVIVVLGSDGIVTYTSPSASQVLGYDPEYVTGKSAFDFVHPDDLPNFLIAFSKAIHKPGYTESMEARLRHKDGSWLVVEGIGISLLDEPSVEGIVIHYRDITERKQAEDKYKRLLEDINDGYCVIQNGKVAYANGRYCEIFGHEPQQIIGQDFNQVTLPTNHKMIKEMYEKVLRGEEVPLKQYEGVGIKADGTNIVIEASLKVIKYEDKPAFSAIIRDITKRKKVEEKIRESEEKFRSIVENSSDRIFMLDKDYRLLSVNKSAADIYNKSPKQLLGRSIFEIFPEDTAIGFSKNIKKVFDTGKSMFIEGKMYIEEREFINSTSLNPIKDANGNIIAVTGIVRDITERRQMEDELRASEERYRSLAITDELTGLYNRRYFYQMLDAEINRSEYYGFTFAVVMLDLDGCKEYNDSFGHISGDAILRSLTEIIRSTIRTADIAFRYGGDEFTIIMPQTKSARARKIIDRISSRWMETTKLDYPNREHPLGLSAGIVQYPDNAETSDGLVFIADAALYHSKTIGRNKSTLASELESIPPGNLSTAIHDQIYALASTVDARDPYTYGHSKRVANMSEAIGVILELQQKELGNLYAAALLHDIGKVGIPDSILTKPGKLTNREWEIMKKHPTEASKIVSHVRGLSGIVPAILHHHEWYDGTGYPDGLHGEEIPLFSRVIAVADAYDTMTTRRPYKSLMSEEEALAELSRCSGTQFDPLIVETVPQAIDLVKQEGSLPPSGVPEL